MEDELKKMEDNLKKPDDDLKKIKNGRRPQIKGQKRRRPQTK